MSEKLFRVMTNESKQWYCIESVDGEMFSMQEVVDMLNSLCDEKEKLQKELHIVETDCKNVKESRNHYREENEQLRSLLKDAEEEIKTLKESNQNLMESLVNKESENDDNQETEVRECSFCGEFRTEYHEYEDYSWSAEDFCNAGHDLEDTDPNSCKDYWDKF